MTRTRFQTCLRTNDDSQQFEALQADASNNKPNNYKIHGKTFVFVYFFLPLQPEGRERLATGCGIYDLMSDDQRDYFHLNLNDDDDSNTPNVNTSPVNAVVLNFGEDETTKITTTNFTNDTNSNDAWYDLNGRKLNGKPTAKGLYINNGHKVVIK